MLGFDGISACPSTPSAGPRSLDRPAASAGTIISGLGRCPDPPRGDFESHRRHRPARPVDHRRNHAIKKRPS